ATNRLQQKSPAKAPRPPTRELWLHEIKHNGFGVRQDRPIIRPGRERSKTPATLPHPQLHTGSALPSDCLDYIQPDHQECLARPRSVHGLPIHFHACALRSARNPIGHNNFLRFGDFLAP
ncbi:MAG: hypothetical protein WAU59_20350, partial [Rhodoplanes sp.]